MARSWEYSPRRRVAMQVVMWVIFGLTLAVAGFVSHRKQLGQLQLAPATQIGDLMVQIPWNWHAKIVQIGDSRMLTASPLQNAPVPFAGEIRISQEPLSGPSGDALAYLANNVLGAVVPTVPIAFPGLGRAGIMAEFVNTDDPADPGSETIPTGLYAVTIVPSGLGKSLAVVVAVENVAPLTQDDYALLHQLVQAVTLAPH